MDCGSGNVHGGGGWGADHASPQCQACQSFNIGRVPTPCWICESYSPDTGMSDLDMYGMGKEIGFSGSIPYIPQRFNVCNGCVQAAKDKILKTLDDLYSQGWGGEE